MVERKDFSNPVGFSRILLALYIVLATAGLTACNTVEGAGKDLSKAGDKIEDTAKDVKRKN